MAIALVLLSFADFVGAALVDAVIDPQHIAAGAAFCAGWLGGRALAIAVRTSEARQPAIPFERMTSDRVTMTVDALKEVSNLGGHLLAMRRFRQRAGD